MNQLDLAVISKFKNLRVWELINGNQRAASQACGVSQSEFGLLINLKKSPFLKDGKTYRLAAVKIASHFKMLAEDLFPASLYELQLPASVQRNYSSAALLPLLAARREVAQLPSPEEYVDSRTLREELLGLLQTLTPREANVIKMRFGLEDGSEYTLEEIGEKFAVSRDRIRQIELKALSKLKHFSRLNRLKGFVDQRVFNEAAEKSNPMYA